MGSRTKGPVVKVHFAAVQIIACDLHQKGVEHQEGYCGLVAALVAAVAEISPSDQEQSQVVHETVPEKNPKIDSS